MKEKTKQIERERQDGGRKKERNKELTNMKLRGLAVRGACYRSAVLY